MVPLIPAGPEPSWTSKFPWTGFSFQDFSRKTSFPLRRNKPPWNNKAGLMDNCTLKQDLCLVTAVSSQKTCFSSQIPKEKLGNKKHTFTSRCESPPDCDRFNCTLLQWHDFISASVRGNSIFPPLRQGYSHSLLPVCRLPGIGVVQAGLVDAVPQDSDVSRHHVIQSLQLLLNPFQLHCFSLSSFGSAKGRWFFFKISFSSLSPWHTGPHFICRATDFFRTYSEGFSFMV